MLFFWLKTSRQNNCRFAWISAVCCQKANRSECVYKIFVHPAERPECGIRSSAGLGYSAGRATEGRRVCPSEHGHLTERGNVYRRKSARMQRNLLPNIQSIRNIRNIRNTRNNKRAKALSNLVWPIWCTRLGKWSGGKRSSMGQIFLEWSLIIRLPGSYENLWVLKHRGHPTRKHSCCCELKGKGSFWSPESSSGPVECASRRCCFSHCPKRSSH